MNSYFDAIKLNLQQEVPVLGTANQNAVEIVRRLFKFIEADFEGKYCVICQKINGTVKVVGANSSFLDFSGYSQEELSDLDVVTCIHPDDQDMVNQACDNDTPIQYVARFVKKNDQIKWCRLQGLSFEADGIHWRYLILELA